MQIKRIGIEDQSVVTALFNDYRVFYKYPPDLPLAERFIRERLEHNESVIFAAIADDGTPAGFTQLYPLISSGRAIKNWVLNDLYVAPDYRKQGIGETLIKAATEFAMANGAAFLQLETAVDNSGALAFYKRHQYSVVKTIPRYYTNGVDAFVLEKDL